MSSALASLRQRHERLVFQRLRRGPATRADLARETGLSPPTIGKVADRLVAAGILEEDSAPTAADAGAPAYGQAIVVELPEVRPAPSIATLPATPALGRPGRLLRLDRSRHRILALQIGVRHTRLAALPVAGPQPGDGAGDWTSTDDWEVGFATPAGPEAWLKALKRAAARVAIEDPWAVTVSVPGVTDEAAGRVLHSPNLHWIEDLDLPDLVRQAVRLDSPVTVVQEIRALALGHLAATGDQDFLLVDFGEGVGGAIVRGGRLYDGALPLSGELGHIPIRGQHRRCGCGSCGCLETLVGRSGLMMEFMKAFGKRRLPDWNALLAWVRKNGVQKWLELPLDATAGVVAGALNILGLRHVVVTGTLTEMSSDPLDYLWSQVQSRAMWGRYEAIYCVGAPRRRAAGLVAAAIDRVIVPAIPADGGGDGV